MLFSGLPFLYFFLPIFFTVYFCSPRRAKNTVLLLASLIFYGWGEPIYLFLMIFTIISGYIFGLILEKQRGKAHARLILATAVALSLAALLFFKYTDFFIQNINALTSSSIGLLKLALPVGISFYTFQMISYLADVYRGGAPAQKNIINLAAYISMFPQLIAGPIVRYTDISREIVTRKSSVGQAALGVRRFIFGLAKKVLLANTLGELCNAYRETQDGSVLFAWLYAAAFTLHIYFDFSGYSDMAIGLGKILGFSFPENFNYPYISGSITEFWRRWHMTLGTWFRDYVYIPLGGSRRGKARQILNLLIVWTLTGFWHGAAWNFILWGFMYALLLIAEKLFLLEALKKSRVLKHAYTLFFVVCGFVIFDAESLSSAFATIGQMFGAGVPLLSAEALYYLKSFSLVLLTAAVGSLPFMKKALLKLCEKNGFEKAFNLIEVFVLLALLVLSSAYLVDGSFNPFLYFRF